VLKVLDEMWLSEKESEMSGSTRIRTTPHRQLRARPTSRTQFNPVNPGPCA
jgi:hypothetical protein